ncbi:hypothetical protein EYF80_051380 [Liparis tanakae]|uniref:Uncharacterized protein n=1 Tax=Liparis tanakae TaxID=230148 RepID=A0A4Z2FC14_9TELE|nr:hypothetical protein EYF80_051380 [Liparis tanakae]
MSEGLWRRGEGLTGDGSVWSKERGLAYSSGQRAVGVGFRSAGTEGTADRSRRLLLFPDLWKLVCENTDFSGRKTNLYGFMS